MVARKEAVHCRKHHIKTPEHIARIKASLQGRRLSMESIEKIRFARLARGPGLSAMHRVCEFCDCEFSVRKPSAKQRFCSKLCGYMNRRADRAPNWLKDMPRVTCRVCKTDFRLASKNVVEQRFCCSMKCKNTWQMRLQKTSGTDIEMMMATALTGAGINYSPQFRVGRYVADFLLPDHLAVVNCDGDFWHKKTAESDRRQTRIFEEKGLKVFRFLGSRIKVDVESCVAEIKCHFFHRNEGKS